MATDSQMTLGGTKQCDSKKLLRVKFKNNAHAVVARAGSIQGADIFHELFESLALETEITGPRTIADAAETALKQARTKILGNARHDAMSSEECITHLDDYYHEMLLAYVYNGKQYMFTGDSKSAVTVKSTHPFVALGSGRGVAASILEGFPTDTLDRNQSTGLAAYVIEMCKRVDLYCAGRPQIGAIGPDGKFLYAARQAMVPLQQAIEITHEAMKETLIIQINKNFREIYRKTKPFDSVAQREQTVVKLSDKSSGDAARDKTVK